jgi:hypothetical protein
MFRLITPLGLLVTTALLVIFAAAAAQVARIEHSLPLAAVAVLAVTASVGTALVKPWSRYLVHLMTLAYTSKWCWSVYHGYQSGYFDFRFGRSTLGAVRSLLPGFALVVLSALCSWLVNRHFSRTTGVKAEPGQR